MKTLKLILAASIMFLLCISCERAMAQAPYKASVGGVLYPSMAIGPSFKAFFTDHVAFQTDILYRVVVTGYVDKKSIRPMIYFLLESNTNVVYQRKFKDKANYELFWLLGGGMSLGFQFSSMTIKSNFSENAKFGVNAMVGFELCAKKIPLAFQMDLRPGYAVIFNHGGNPIEVLFNSIDTPWHHFDWLLVFTLRYTFKTKQNNE